MKRRTLISIIATVVVVLALIIYSAMSGHGRYLFSNNDVFKLTGTLIGGERGRLILAIMELEKEFLSRTQEVLLIEF